MARYYVNRQAQSNGDHEVHRSDCYWLPSPENRVDLGEHTGCHSAVRTAKTIFPQSNGCRTCSTECHTT